MNGHWQFKVGLHGVTSGEHTGTGARVQIDDETASVSDGYHTFDELYLHRTLIAAGWFNNLYESDNRYGTKFDPYKTLQHARGEDPMFSGMFKVGAMLPTGEVTYHCNVEHWDLFHLPVLDRSPLWDGHTADDVADRIRKFLERT